MTTRFARKAGAYHPFVIALAVLASHVASGNPGDIDPSFADRGFFTSTELPGSANSILAAGDGTYFISGGYTTATRSWDFDGNRLHGAGFLGRLTTAGTFAALGPVLPGEVLTTVLQPDQKIVGIARTTTIRGWKDSAFRLQPDGAPDTGFGSGGWVDVAIGGVTLPSRTLFLTSPALVLEPGGGFTVAESRGIDLEVTRGLPDGTWDDGFADGGTYVGQSRGPVRK